MAVLDELSVRISADTTSFQVGAEQTEMALDDLSKEAIETAAAMQLLQGRADEAEDEIDTVGRSAVAASAGLSTFGGAAGLSAIGVNQLSGSIAVSLIPALAVLSTTLAPILGALGGFVAVAGAIGATAILPTMGAIATRTEELQAVFGLLTSTLQEEFQPVFDVAANVLFELMGAFIDIIPEMVPAQDVISQLAGNFAQLGNDIIDLLPALVDLAVSLSQEFLPPFVSFAQDALPQVPGLITRLVTVFDRMLPRFLRAGRLLMDLLPAFTEFGFVTLSVVGPALTELTQLGTDVLQFFNSLDTRLRQASAAISLVTPILLGLVTVLGGPVTLALGAVAGAVALFAKAWETNFAGIRDVIQTLWSEVQDVLPSIKGAIDAFVSGIDFSAIIDAAQDFEQVLGTQLRKTVDDLGPVFDDFTEFLNDNQEEFALIGGVVSDVVSAMIRLATLTINVLGPVFRTFLIPLLTGFIDVLDVVLQAVGNAIQAFGELRQGNLQAAEAAFTEGLDFSGTLGMEQPRVQDALSGQQTVRVVVDEETDIVNARIEEGAERVVNNESRRVRRNTGSTTGI